MVSIGKCEGCRAIPPRHCYGTGDRHPSGGKIGGFHCTCSCRSEATTTTSGDKAEADDQEC